MEESAAGTNDLGGRAAGLMSPQDGKNQAERPELRLPSFAWLIELPLMVLPVVPCGGAGVHFEPL